MSITFSEGLSIRNRVSVPGVVLYVKMIEFLGSWHHCIKRSLEKPQSKSGWLARTTLGLGTRAKSVSPWHRDRWRNWKGLFLLSSKHLISLSLIHSTFGWEEKQQMMTWSAFLGKTWSVFTMYKSYLWTYSHPNPMVPSSCRSSRTKMATAVSYRQRGVEGTLGGG